MVTFDVHFFDLSIIIIFQTDVFRGDMAVWVATQQLGKCYVREYISLRQQAVSMNTSNKLKLILVTFCSLDILLSICPPSFMKLILVIWRQRSE